MACKQKHLYIFPVFRPAWVFARGPPYGQWAVKHTHTLPHHHPLLSARPPQLSVTGSEWLSGPLSLIQRKPHAVLWRPGCTLMGLGQTHSSAESGRQSAAPHSTAAVTVAEYRPWTRTPPPELPSNVPRNAPNPDWTEIGLSLVIPAASCIYTGPDGVWAKTPPLRGVS